MFDLIVIGAGPGGYEAAAHAGGLGKSVALVEKAELGGTCLNVGCIPAKTFLRSSRLFRECREAAAFGIILDAPSFDMPSLLVRKDNVVGTLKRGVSSLLRSTGVEVLNGTGRLVGRNAVEVAGERYEAANILIASGSRPATPPIPGIDGERVLDSTSAFELKEVPERIAIVGGGYIGLEFASFFHEIGAQVTVYEALTRIASGCDGDIGDELLKILRRGGIEFHLSCSVLGIEGSTLHYQDAGSAPASDSATYILNATGRAPIVSDLGLEEVGVDASPRGIRVDDQGRTNVPNIWACGDVTGRHMLAHVAVREGIVAVNSMFGRPDRMRYDAIPAVIYSHPEVSMVGKTEEELQAAGIEYRKGVVPMALAGRFLVEHVRETGIVKVLAGAAHGEILGVHAIGDLSSEFIVAAGAMIEAEMTLAQASEVIFPHPTVAEALHAAILKAQRPVA
ncbi:MAG: dihydrolipoyl dehydrogenase [Acidimicrobiales bacterium]|jgi:dihydrolipoamide dehydrogenase